MTDRPPLECSRWEMIVVTAEVCSVSTVCSTMFPLNPAPRGPEGGGALIKAFPVLWLTGILSCCGPFTEVTCCWQHWRNGHLCVCSCVFSITLLWAWHQSKMKRPAARSHAHILTPLLLWPCWSAFVFFLGWKEKGGGSDLDRFCKDGRPLREENKHRYKRLVWFNRQDEVW